MGPVQFRMLVVREVTGQADQSTRTTAETRTKVLMRYEGDTNDILARTQMTLTIDDTCGWPTDSWMTDDTAVFSTRENAQAGWTTTQEVGTGGPETASVLAGEKGGTIRIHTKVTALVAQTRTSADTGHDPTSRMYCPGSARRRLSATKDQPGSEHSVVQQHTAKMRELDRVLRDNSARRRAADAALREARMREPDDATATDEAVRALIGTMWTEFMDLERRDGHGRTITWTVKRAAPALRRLSHAMEHAGTSPEEEILQRRRIEMIREDAGRQGMMMVEKGLVGTTDWEDEIGERNTTDVDMNPTTTLTHHDTGTSTEWRNDPGMQTAFEEATPTHKHMERARAHQREHDDGHPTSWHTSVPHELVYTAHSLAADGKHSLDAWDWEERM